MEWKWIFGVTAIVCFTALQIAAWYLGIDGQVFAFTTSAIAGLLTFLTGVNLTEGYYRNKIMKEKP